MMRWSKEDAQINGEVIRQMVIHESTVVNHRLNWMLAVNGMLFAAAGYILKDAPAWKYVLPGLAALGVFMTASVSVTLYQAAMAVQSLASLWDDKKPIDYDGPPVLGYWARPKPLIIIMQPTLIVPVCLGLAWVFVLLRL